MDKPILNLQVEMDEDFNFCKITSSTNVKDNDKLVAMITAGAIALIQNNEPDKAQIPGIAMAAGMAIIQFAHKPLRNTEVNIKDLH